MIRLSKLEEQIMDTLWDLQKAFPKVILSEMEQPTPPYNTVLSAIRKLEKHGYVGYEKYGKSHQYYPILKKEQYAKSLFKKLFVDLMDRSPSAIVSYFADGSKEDMDLLKKALKDWDDDRSS